MYHQISTLKQERQCTCNLTLRLVRLTVVIMEIHSVCIVDTYIAVNSIILKVFQWKRNKAFYSLLRYKCRYQKHETHVGRHEVPGTSVLF